MQVLYMILRVLWAVLIPRKLKTLLVGPHTNMLCVFDTDVQNAAVRILHFIRYYIINCLNV
jgi:hypothetical protein